MGAAAVRSAGSPPADDVHTTIRGSLPGLVDDIDDTVDNAQPKPLTDLPGST